MTVCVTKIPKSLANPLAEYLRLLGVLAFSNRHGKPCDHQKVSKNWASRRQVFQLVQLLLEHVEVVQQL